MSGRYFEFTRREILPHLPARVGRMLDVGCGSGATGGAVREARAVEWAGGVELVEAEAERAGQTCDKVWSVDIQTERIEAEIEPGSLDLILCLDILEHLVDPWSVVDRLSPLLAPDGRMILSVPNIRNWKFLFRLAFKGDFTYTDAGLLDRTHLRFFVRGTAVALAEHGGLGVTFVGGAQGWKPMDTRRLLSLATFGALDDLMVKQWLVVAARR